MRYESDTLFVLKNLNVVIESTEKVIILMPYISTYQVLKSGIVD